MSEWFLEEVIHSKHLKPTAYHKILKSWRRYDGVDDLHIKTFNPFSHLIHRASRES